MAQTIKAFKKNLENWNVQEDLSVFVFLKPEPEKTLGSYWSEPRFFFKSNYLAELLHLCLLFKFVSFRLHSHKTWHWLVTSWTPVSHKRLTATFRNHLPNQSWNATSSCQGITVWSVGWCFSNQFQSNCHHLQLDREYTCFLHDLWLPDDQ